MELLHKLLNKSCPQIHEGRIGALIKVVHGLLNRGNLSIVGLGRHLKGCAKVRHKIKLVDRLLGNPHLWKERLSIYQALASQIIGKLKKLEIIVDWSPCPHQKAHMLKASLVFKDRAVVLYEEVHQEKDLGKGKVHRNFLQRLKSLLPKSCEEVTIITDAGFRTDWFQLVLDNGWDFVGRIRSTMQYTVDEEGFYLCTSLYEVATHRPKRVGRIKLTKAKQLPVWAYLYKGKPRAKKEVRKGSSGVQVKAYRKSYQDPWLLVTSHSPEAKTSKEIVNCYRRRMKIEHNFRDLKDVRWGLGLSYSRTQDIRRLEILLLVGTLAIFVLWLIGLATEAQKGQYDYQSNTIKNRRVLSLIYLGLQVLWHTGCPPGAVLMRALKETQWRESLNNAH